jgi:hypothetical protein
VKKIIVTVVVVSALAAVALVGAAHSAEMVVYTKSGERYHLPSCRYTYGKIKGECARSDAESHGLSACKVCQP